MTTNADVESRSEAPLLLSVPDAAVVLGIGKTLMWEMVRRGDVPVVRLGRRVLIPRAALHEIATRTAQEG